MTQALRGAIVGPGRRRNGLAPFLATFLEERDIEIVAGVGRDAARARHACEELATRLGHAVAPFADVRDMLAAVRPDVLVIASPPESHLDALAAAADARLPTLCEKPLVPAGCTERVRPVLERFEAAGVLLVENCQWPEVLPAFDALWPDRAPVARAVAMGLSPSAAGRAMVADSLSHLLSLVQAVAPVDARSALDHVRWAGAADATEAVELTFRIEHPERGALDARLVLRRVPTQPRPAWIEIDGRRAERRIAMPGYTFVLEANDGRTEPAGDPMRALVYGFAEAVREPQLDRIREHIGRIRHRARLYATILAAWPG